MTNAPRPGWYPDPAGTADQFRWWGGNAWTDHVSSSPNAPTPSGDAPVEADLPRRRSPVRAAVALIVIGALFLSAGVGVGLWLWGDAAGGRTEAGGRTPPVRSAASAADPSGLPGQLEKSTRVATIGSASMQLPDEPYELHDDPVSVDSVFEVAFVAEAEVHRQYDGDHDWWAMVGLAAIDPELVDGSDLTQAGSSTLTTLAARLYGKTHKITRVRWADRSVDNHPGLEFSARVHYAIDRLPSSYDTVTGVFVRLEDGTVVAAVTAVPNDADPRVARLAAESLASLTIV